METNSRNSDNYHVYRRSVFVIMISVLPRKQETFIIDRRKCRPVVPIFGRNTCPIVYTSIIGTGSSDVVTYRRNQQIRLLALVRESQQMETHNCDAGTGKGWGQGKV